MPDMTYSRAYETYAPAAERLKNSSATGAQYTGHPAPGTIARGEMFPYSPKNDSAGIIQSETVKNPLPPLDAKQYLEAARLYQINCAICHGTKLDGNGPLFNGGDGPYIATPAQLIGNPVYESLSEGRIYHAITYGKGQMGSYASQLTPQQRWMITHYIKEKQAVAKGGNTGGATTDSTGAAGGTMPEGTQTQGPASANAAK